MRSQNHDVLRTYAAIIPLRDRCQSAVQGRHRPAAVPVARGREARPFGQGAKLAERRTIEADEACLAGPVGEQPEQDRPRVGAQNSVRGGRERHFQKLSRGQSRSSEIGTPSGMLQIRSPSRRSHCGTDARDGGAAATLACRLPPRDQDRPRRHRTFRDGTPSRPKRRSGRDLRARSARKICKGVR